MSSVKYFLYVSRALQPLNDNHFDQTHKTQAIHVAYSEWINNFIIKMNKTKLYKSNKIKSSKTKQKGVALGDGVEIKRTKISFAKLRKPEEHGYKVWRMNEDNLASAINGDILKSFI